MHTGQIEFRRWLHTRLIASVLLLTAGCATTPQPSTAVKAPADVAPPSAPPSQPEPPDEIRSAFIGEVVRVNAADRYVVVRCRRLPSEGEEARVEREQWQKGRIRFTQPMQAPFATADILRGEVDPGDQVLR